MDNSQLKSLNCNKFWFRRKQPQEAFLMPPHVSDEIKKIISY